jgi:hypothetical protein
MAVSKSQNPKFKIQNWISLAVRLQTAATVGIFPGRDDSGNGYESGGLPLCGTHGLEGAA